jgi:hypothetical protein
MTTAMPMFRFEVDFLSDMRIISRHVAKVCYIAKPHCAHVDARVPI